MKLHSGVVIADAAFPMMKLTEIQIAVLKMASGYLTLHDPYLCTGLARVSMRSPRYQGKRVRRHTQILRKMFTEVLGERISLFTYLVRNGVTGMSDQDECNLRLHWIELLAEYNGVAK